MTGFIFRRFIGRSSVLQKSLLASAISSCLAMPATAQQTLEEVIVTSNKRPESLQDVSIAVTAITGENMRNQGITGIEDLANLAPAFLVSEDGGNVQVSLRGVVTTNFVESGDPATAFHVDEIYYARPSSLTGTFYDIERVELLRGPQGTLYGRNANAGSLNVITNKPVQEFDGEFELGIGDYNQRTFYGMVNSPVTQTFATRFAVNYLKRDGYVDERFIEDSTSADEIAGRAQFLWEPSDSFSWLVAADYWESQGRPSNQVPVGDDGDPVLERFADFQDEFDLKLWGIGSTINFDLSDSLTLTSVTGYRENTRNILADGDDDDLGVGDAIQLTDNTQDQFSQELRLTSDSDGPFNWITGLYYLKEEQSIYAIFGGLITSGLGLHFPQPEAKAEAKAVFADGTLDLSDKVRLLAGLRYTDESKSRTGGTYLAFGIDPRDESFNERGVLLSENIADISWDATTWKLGAEWDVADESMLYLTVGTGFKAGGYFDGVQSPETSVSYDPEEILAWSFGSKNKLWDNRAQVNFEAFHYSYEGYQVSEVDPIPPFGGARGLVTYNADEAEIFGFEVDAMFVLGEGGQLTTTLGYLETEFTDFEIERNVDITDPNAEPGFLDATGNELPRAPELTFSTSYQHTWTLDSGAEITGRVSGKYVADYFLSYENDAAEFQESHSIFDMFVSYRPADNGWYLNAFVNNISDKLICTAPGTVTGDTRTCIASTPRTVGLKVGFNF